MRSHVRRAFASTIVAIESEAAAPCVEAVREADRVIADLVAALNDPALGDEARAHLVKRAEATRDRIRGLGR